MLVIRDYLIKKIKKNRYWYWYDLSTNVSSLVRNVKITKSDIGIGTMTYHFVYIKENIGMIFIWYSSIWYINRNLINNN
jgi:hypothetical protein